MGGIFVRYSSGKKNSKNAPFLEISEKKSTSVLSTDLSVDGIGASNDTSRNFDCFSDEVLLKILKLLDLRSLCYCSQVNKRFRSLAQDSHLYKSLSLSSYHKRVNDKLLDFLAPRCRSLCRLDLSRCGGQGNITPGEFKTFLNVCGHSLTDLNLHSAHFVNDSILKEISLICRSLRNLDLYSCEITNDGFEYLASLDSLESFAIVMDMNIQQPTLIRIIQKNRKIKHLDLESLRHDNIDVVLARAIADSCPHLESIKLANKDMSNQVFEELARCINLRHINIARVRVFTTHGEEDSMSCLKTLFASCVRLETINLEGVYNFTDKDLEPLLLCPIEKLNLTAALYLTTNMCSRFFASWPGLREITLSMCENISDTDVREWRKRYPRVSIYYIPYEIFDTDPCLCVN